MDALDRTPHRQDPPGTVGDASVLGLAAILAVGATMWLYGVHAVASVHADTWSGHLTHVIRDALLAFPLALLAVGIGRWLAERWGMGEPSVGALLGQAALISFTFTLLLVPAVGLHQLIDRALDGPTHAFHGQQPPGGIAGASGILRHTLHGLHDAFVGQAAALPLMLLGLVLLARRRGHGRAAMKALRDRAWAGPGRLIVPAAFALAVLGVGLAGRSVVRGDADHDRVALIAHSPVVTNVAVGAGTEADGLRLVVHSALWMRQPREREPRAPAPANTNPEPDRVYVDVTVENLEARARTFGRREFRLLSRDGMAWAPLADDFPAILLEPQGRLSTRLIFEVPERAARLLFVWATEKQEARIPIGDDALGRLSQGTEKDASAR
jgi:hypothetical protein